MSAGFSPREISILMHHTVRFIVLPLLFFVPCFTMAQSLPATALEAIRAFALPGTEPIVADATHPDRPHTTVAAIVHLTKTSAAIMIARETRTGAYEVIARSRSFALSRESNVGAWIEEFRFAPPDRIELSLTSRSGCARSVATHRFALRNGVWLVTGLDVSAMRCTDDGVEQDRTESANYLTGRVVRTTFTSSKPPKTTHGPATRGAFPLSEFPPDGPEVVYAEMR